MINHKVVGTVLVIVAFVLYYFKPFDFTAFEFLTGVIAAIGVSLLLGWFKKK